MNKNIKIFFFILFILLIGCLSYYRYKAYKLEIQLESQPIIYVLNYKDKSPFKGKNPKEYLMNALEYYNIKHKDIVYKQAVLETGGFNSEGCTKDNNLFGIMYNGKHCKFNNWEESVIAYKCWVQYKYKGGDYYDFLNKIGYATDSEYINKLKSIKIN